MTKVRTKRLVTPRHFIRRVLCAEDNKPTGNVLRLFLESGGYKVRVAENGEEAWRLLCAEGADVLVTDCQMPRLSGLELVARARAAGFTLPIILVFGSLEALCRDEPEEFDIAGILLKPYSQKQLLTAVEHALTRRLTCESRVH